MEPKNPIIIDGVDVSGCLFYQANFEEDYDVKIKHYCSNCHNSCKSGNSSNCYYKQLARKERECDELKEIIQRHDNDNNALLKEVENELCEYYRRHRECLTEIKEIAKNMNEECFYDDFDCTNCDMQNGCTYFNKEQILQKISEVLDE